jgi:Fe-S-cluster containining protein
MSGQIERNCGHFGALPIKRELLERVYETYSEMSAGFPSACKVSCAACCTQNVLCTTLEAAIMLEQIESLGLPNLLIADLQGVSPKRLRPTLTINSLAEHCLRSEEIPEIQEAAENPSCPFLEHGSCLTYAFRPFACRSMWSDETCRPQGEAVMNPMLVSISGVFQQIIEDMDSGGLYGNLLDLLSYLNEPERRKTYVSGAGVAPGDGLLRNAPSPGFIVPPEHRPYVMKWLNRLWEKKVAGLPFKEALQKLREAK